EIATTGKKVDYVVIQECGGTLKTVSKGAEIVSKMAREVSKEVITSFDTSRAILLTISAPLETVFNVPPHSCITT
ncbi:hypothetical protein BGU87_19525, partial [Clostridioides difficile]